ncbi:MAG TPA: hypothetical protein VK067_08495 [Pseudogracilibacillus sp.]|nr:hypothetical protein [Pseudogracilibacillus sp.]
MRIFLYMALLLVIFIAGMSFQTNKEAVDILEPIEVEEEQIGWEEHELEKEAIIMQENDHMLYTTTSFVEDFFGSLFDKLVQLLYAIASLFFSA